MEMVAKPDLWNTQKQRRRFARSKIEKGLHYRTPSFSSEAFLKAGHLHGKRCDKEEDEHIGA